MGESSMGRSPILARTRSLTESVMPMFLRSCVSAAWIRRSADVVVMVVVIVEDLSVYFSWWLYSPSAVD